MTCIAVVKQDGKIFMAGDRGASDDDNILALSAPKVWKIGEYLLGYAGTMDGERIRHNFKPPAPEKNLDKFMYSKFIKYLRTFYENWWVDTSKDSDFGMIICVRGRIFEHNAIDMSLTEYQQPFLAMGSGAQYAYGSLYSTHKSKNARNRVRTAVAAAIQYSPTCMGPIDSISI